MDLTTMKAISSMLVSSGVGSIISNACNHVRPDNISRLDKIIGGIGSIAISLYISDKISEYAEEKFDEIIQKIQEKRDVNKESVVENECNIIN